MSEPNSTTSILPNQSNELTPIIMTSSIGIGTEPFSRFYVDVVGDTACLRRLSQIVFRSFSHFVSFQAMSYDMQALQLVQQESVTPM